MGLTNIASETQVSVYYSVFQKESSLNVKVLNILQSSLLILWMKKWKWEVRKYCNKGHIIVSGITGFESNVAFTIQCGY